jgi:hypothetical protein
MRCEGGAKAPLRYEGATSGRFEVRGWSLRSLRGTRYILIAHTSLLEPRAYFPLFSFSYQTFAKKKYKFIENFVF